MKRRDEERIEAYRDGALAPRRHATVERSLRDDPEHAGHLRRTEALGDLVREVWSEGPPAPRADMVIQSLRPALARVDAELEDAPSLRLWWRRLRDSLGPVPIAAAAATAVVALALAGPELVRGPDSGLSTAGVAPALVSPGVGSPTAIYDLSQDGPRPLMIFQGDDGSTVIWILDIPDEPSTAVTSDGRG